MEWIKSVVEALAKTSLPIILAGVLFASAILSALPDSWLTLIGLAEFRRANSAWIGLAFVLSASLLLALGLARVIAIVTERVKARKSASARSAAQQRDAENRLNILRKLTPGEKAHLLPYIRDGLTTQNFPMQDGVIGGLSAKRVVFRSSQMFDLIDGCPYNLQPWAREILREQPELLNGAADESYVSRWDRY